MQSLVSVIVPVYKVEQYLDKCLESIVSQTYRNLEIILVDDGSPDSCPQKCDDWAKRDSRVKVIHKKNAGLGFARNSGLEIAKGDFIAFVDSDDFLSLDAIEIMVKRICQDKSDLVITRWATAYEDGHQGEEYYPWMLNTVLSREQIMQMLGARTQKLPVFACGKLYRIEIFKNLRFNDLKCGEDLYLLPHIVNCCETISIDSAITYFYLQRATSIMHTRTRVQIVDNILALLHVSRFLFESGYIEGASRYYYSAFCEFLVQKNDKEIKQIIKDCYNKTEKKLLKKYIDKRIVKNILIAKFPSLYQFYKSYKNG